MNRTRKMQHHMKNPHRSLVLSLALFLFGTALLSGLGKKDITEYQPVEGSANWETRFDLSGLEPGEYNILVRGTDDAGNTGIGGPWNIYVDPESTIPGVGVSFPSEGAVLGSSFTLVGTAWDDDGIAGVELAVNEGEFFPLNGTSFWSYHHDGADTRKPDLFEADGIYSLHFRSLDIEGNYSEIRTMDIEIDRNGPVLALEKPQAGERLSGKIRFSGTISDGNGIEAASLSYTLKALSADGEAVEFQEPIRLKKKRKSSEYSFSFSLNTGKLPDGPQVLSLSALDGTGTGADLLLPLFIDNAPPELKIIHPHREEGELPVVGGLFHLLGEAEDGGELKELRYRSSNGMEGIIPLQAGNPVWVQEFDYRGHSNGKEWILLTLEDAAGNKTVLKEQFHIDQTIDEPRVVLFPQRVAGEDPSGPISFDGTARFSGWIEDDDGAVSRLEYRIDGGEWESVDTSGPWALSFGTDSRGNPNQDNRGKQGILSRGRHRIEFRGVDRFDVTGPVDTRDFLIRTPPAWLVDLEKVDSGQEGVKSPWFSGDLLDYGRSLTLQGTVQGDGTEVKLFVRRDGGDEKKVGLKEHDETGMLQFSLPISGREDPGMHQLVLILEDQYNRRSSRSLTWFRRGKPDKEGNMETPEVGKGLDLPEFETGSLLPLLPGVKLYGWVPRGEIVSISSDSGNDLLDYHHEGRFFTIQAGGNKSSGSSNSGSAEGTTLTVAGTGGESYQFTLPPFTTDHTPPVIAFSGANPGESISGPFFSGALEISGTVADEDDLRLSCELVPGGSREAPVTEDVDIEGGSFRVSIDRTGTDSGPLLVRLRGVDSSGNEAVVEQALFHDPSPPEIQYVTPVETLSGTGKTTLFGFIHENGTSGLVRMGNLVPEISENRFILDLNISTLELDQEGSVTELPVTAEDGLGNSKETLLSLAGIEGYRQGWKPEIRLIHPDEGAFIEASLELSGTALDKEGLEYVEYSLNGKEWKRIGGDALFSIPVAEGDLLNHENRIKVRGADKSGYMSDEVERSFFYSPGPPDITISTPGNDEVLGGIILLSGKGEDENGIADLFFSFDNGNSFNRGMMEEDGSWNYHVDSTLFPDGTLPVLVRMRDQGGAESLSSLLLNIDNTAPQLSLERPGEGEGVYGKMAVEGMVSDTVSLKSTKIYLSPAGESSSEESLLEEFSGSGVFLKSIHTEDYPEGKYLLQVEAVDKAGNAMTLNRLVVLEKPTIRPPIVVSPLPGETVGPLFDIEGTIPEVNLLQQGGVSSGQALLVLDGKVIAPLDLDQMGRYLYRIEPEMAISPGEHTLSVRWETEGNQVSTRDVPFTYQSEGLWISFDDFKSGDTLGDRGILHGSAGWFSPGPTRFADAGAEKEYLRTRKKLQPQSLEISFDQGRSFIPLHGRSTWEYPLFRQNHGDGELHVLIKATGEDGTAYARRSILFDTKEPQIELLEPEENGRYNDTLVVSGTATEGGKIEVLEAGLRMGGKEAYGTPSFIQGMYFDLSGLGITWFNTGMGMSFMDDNVKLQVQYGYAPERYWDEAAAKYQTARFGGHVLGAKLLANIAFLPWDFLFGPRFQQWSSTFALGANFSYFNNPSDNTGETWGVVLAGVIAQTELVKYTFRERRFLTYLSLFGEMQLWMISSDVKPEVKPLPSIGLRLGLF